MYTTSSFISSSMGFEQLMYSLRYHSGGEGLRNFIIIEVFKSRGRIMVPRTASPICADVGRLKWEFGEDYVHPPL